MTRPLSDVMAGYELPPAFRDKLEAAFADLSASRGVSYILENEERHSRFDGKQSRDKECAYRALGQYAANVISELCSSAEGQELHRILTEVMTGSRHGVILKGLPSDIGSKGLFVFGIKTLLGDKEGVDNWFRADLPEIISRAPRDSYYFHRDGFDDDGSILKSPDKRSFLFMGLAQAEPLVTPTLVKLAEDPDELHAEIHFKPDEMAFFDNKTLKHSTGLKTNSDIGGRRVFRYIVDCTTLSHSPNHQAYVKGLMHEANVPENQGELKNWLLDEMKKLENQKREQRRPKF